MLFAEKEKNWFCGCVLGIDCENIPPNSLSELQRCVQHHLENEMQMTQENYRAWVCGSHTHGDTGTQFSVVCGDLSNTSKPTAGTHSCLSWGWPACLDSIPPGASGWPHTAFMTEKIGKIHCMLKRGFLFLVVWGAKWSRKIVTTVAITVNTPRVSRCQAHCRVLHMH